MPMYDFYNEKTDEIETHRLSLSEREQFIKDNPHLKQQISAPSIVSKGGQGALSKAGDGWKEVQDKIKSGLPPRLRGNIKTK